ncbi:MAG TPA: MFS transporter [Spirochaetia bacterium]|nr:MFS transporter [Spirochaetia bacterium]
MGDTGGSKWWVLTAVLLGVIMGPIDASAVYIAMPDMSRVFGVSPATVGWVSMAYLLVLASFLLSFGRLGDMVGFKKVYQTGLLVFVATSALCGLAPSLGVLVFLRALQAAGSGMTMAMSPAIITAVFPPEERGKALGMNGMVVALGLAAGPSLGGLLVGTIGWRAIFYVNVPIGIAAYFWCRHILPKARALARRPFDWQGALLAFAGLGLLLWFVDRASSAGWSWLTILYGLAAVTALSWFVAVEKRIAEPMLDLGLFRSRVFSAANGAALLNFMAQYVIAFLTPFLLQQVLGYSAEGAGEIMTAFPLMILVIAPFAGILSDRIGHRGLAFTGLFICMVAGLLFARLTGGASGPVVALHLGIFGLGTGLFGSPNSSAVMGAVPRSRLGIAGSVLATTRNTGMALGIMTAGAVLTATQAAHGGSFVAGLTAAYLAAAGLSLAGALITLLGKEEAGFSLEGGNRPGLT